MGPTDRSYSGAPETSNELAPGTPHARSGNRPAYLLPPRIARCNTGSSVQLGNNSPGACICSLFLEASFLHFSRRGISGLKSGVISILEASPDGVSNDVIP
jgi:hypothetical protein